MNNIFIHVGLRKTATTWLQNELFQNIENINYIAKNESNYPNWLIKWHYLDDYAFEMHIEEIKNSFFSLVNENKINILSSEAFTNTSVIYSQANRIKKIVPNAKVIITLRNPIDVIKSHYKLDLQDGINFLELEKYLDWERTPYDLFKRKPIYLPDFFYNENIKYYQNLFGKENVLILRYEDMKNNPDSYFTSLSTFLNINIDHNLFKLNKKTNESNRDDIAMLKLKNMKSFLSDNIDCDFSEINISEKCSFTDTIMPDKLRIKLEKYFEGKCYGYY